MRPRVKFFLYVRKSTDEIKRQVTSLDAQNREMREIAKRNQLHIVDELEESKTAKEPGRSVFNRMLDRIEQGDANALLCWDIDRLYRNPIDEGRVRWMLQRGIIQVIQTPTRCYTPADAGLLIAIDGGRATDFIIKHRRDVGRGVEEKLLRGEWPGARPVGYLYDYDLRNIVPDRKRAKTVFALYTEFSEGRVGLSSIAQRLFESGIRSKGGRTWSKSAVHKFLTNKLYVGVMRWGGKIYEGKYQAIISPELFAKVQRALKDRSKPRRTRVGHEFPFRGLFQCSCGSMITAQWAKGNGGLYRYYRCTRKRHVCSERYLREHVVADQCAETVKSLAITPDEANILRALIDEEARLGSETREAAENRIAEELAHVQRKLNKLTHGFIDELIDEESYQSMTANLIMKKAALKQEKKHIRAGGGSSWIEPVKEAVEALEMAFKAQTEKSPKEISRLVQRIGTNRQISSKKVKFEFAAPYGFAASLLAEMPTTRFRTATARSAENRRSTQWCRLVDHLQTFFQEQLRYSPYPSPQGEPLEGEESDISPGKSVEKSHASTPDLPRLPTGLTSCRSRDRKVSASLPPSGKRGNGFLGGGSRSVPHGFSRKNELKPKRLRRSGLDPSRP